MEKESTLVGGEAAGMNAETTTNQGATELKVNLSRRETDWVEAAAVMNSNQVRTLESTKTTQVYDGQTDPRWRGDERVPLTNFMDFRETWAEDEQQDGGLWEEAFLWQLETHSLFVTHE